MCALCFALKWPAFWWLCFSGIRLKAVYAETHLPQHRPVQAQSHAEMFLGLARTAWCASVSCYTNREPGKSGQRQGMKLAEATFKQNLTTTETCRSSQASMRLPEDDSSPKALFLLITLDFSWLWVNPKSCSGWKEAWVWSLQESMGIGSSFAPRSDQIFTIRYVRHWWHDFNQSLNLLL